MSANPNPIFPNQEKHPVHKPKLIKGEFSAVNIEDYVYAFNLLSPTALAIWFIISKNRNGYKDFVWYSNDLAKTIGRSRTQVKAAHRELKEKGFIDQNGEFWVRPPEVDLKRQQAFNEIRNNPEKFVDNLKEEIENETSKEERTIKKQRQKPEKHEIDWNAVLGDSFESQIEVTYLNSIQIGSYNCPLLKYYNSFPIYDVPLQYHTGPEDLIETFVSVIRKTLRNDKGIIKNNDIMINIVDLYPNFWDLKIQIQLEILKALGYSFKADYAPEALEKYGETVT